jgi:hypothetical protein|tara:strand:+ start:3666 stop:3854 length:189 start_codon:yes stop_codon:yes gene_type:complete
MTEKLTKAQIVGELLAEEQITAEEAITLLSEKPTTVVYNIVAPSKQDIPLYGNMWTANTTLD